MFQCKDINNRKHQQEKLKSLIFLPELEKEIFDSYENMSISEKSRLIYNLDEIGLLESKVNLVKNIIKYNITKFSKSINYDNAEANYSSLMSPIANILDDADLRFLLNQCVLNQNKKFDQLVYQTSFFIKIFNSSIDKYPDILVNWQNFINKKRGRGYSDLEELMENRINK